MGLDDIDLPLVAKSSGKSFDEALKNLIFNLHSNSLKSEPNNASRLTLTKPYTIRIVNSVSFNTAAKKEGVKTRIAPEENLFFIRVNQIGWCLLGIENIKSGELILRLEGNEGEECKREASLGSAFKIALFRMKAKDWMLDFPYTEQFISMCF